jgi:VanZ family protein
MTSSEKGTSWRCLSQYQIRAAKNAGSQWPVANHSARCTSRGVCGIVAMALIIFASVMLPAKWEQLRPGHWALEHFLAYFAAASIVCFGWHRPFVVAGGLGAIAAPLLEVLQSFEPTHSANFLSVISGASGAFAAALAVSAAASIARRRPRGISFGRDG